MALVAIHTRTNCGPWILVDDEDRAFGLEPWLVEELPPAISRAAPPPWLVRSAFWGGRAERVERIAALIPDVAGAATAVLPDLGGRTGRFRLSAREVAALLGLLDERIAA
jgi:hypothetical protein